MKAKIASEYQSMSPAEFRRRFNEIADYHHTVEAAQIAGQRLSVGISHTPSGPEVLQVEVESDSFDEGIFYIPSYEEMFSFAV